MTAENSNYINLFNDNNQEDDLTYFEQTDNKYEHDINNEKESSNLMSNLKALTIIFLL